MPEHCRMTRATLWSASDFYIFYNFKEGDPDRMKHDGVQLVHAESREIARQVFLQTKVKNPELFVINQAMTDKEYWDFMAKK